MNRHFLVLIITLLCTSIAFAQLPDHRKPHQKPHHHKEDRKHHHHDEVPEIPGWVHVYELDTEFIHYVKSTEVTLLDWCYFMLDRYKTERIMNETYRFIIPEKNEINDMYLYSIPELEGLWDETKSIEKLTPAAIKNALVANGVEALPITGITYEAAESYLEYVAISYKGTTVSGIHNSFDPKHNISKYKMMVALPTIEEYRILLSNYHHPSIDSAQYHQLIARGYDAGMCPMFNAGMPDEVMTGPCAAVQPNSPLVEKFGRPGRAIYPVASFIADPNGLYDLRGNVSEMVKGGSVAMGGGYRTQAASCSSESAQAYTKPSSWLGFRCMILLKKL